MLREAPPLPPPVLVVSAVEGLENVATGLVPVAVAIELTPEIDFSPPPPELAPPSPPPLAEELAEATVEALVEEPVEIGETPVVLLLVFFFPTVPPTAPPTTAAMITIAIMTMVIFPLVVERKDLWCGAAAGGAARVAYFSRGVVLASMSLRRGGVGTAGGVTLLAGAAAPDGR